MFRHPRRPPLFPSTTLSRSRAGSLLLQPNPPPNQLADAHRLLDLVLNQRPALRSTVAYWRAVALTHEQKLEEAAGELEWLLDRKSTRLNSSHSQISYAVFCL